MKKILLIVIIFSILGCETETSTSPSSKLNSNSVVIVENCEYFKVNAYGSYTYVHKGNCNNPIHCYNNVE